MRQYIGETCALIFHFQRCSPTEYYYYVYFQMRILILRERQILPFWPGSICRSGAAKFAGLDWKRVRYPRFGTVTCSR
jgi:hypothetical protein